MFSAIVGQFPSTIPLALSHCKYKPLIILPDFYMLLLISLQKLVTFFYVSNTIIAISYSLNKYIQYKNHEKKFEVLGTL